MGLYASRKVTDLEVDDLVMISEKTYPINDEALELLRLLKEPRGHGKWGAGAYQASEMVTGVEGITPSSFSFPVYDEEKNTVDLTLTYKDAFVHPPNVDIHIDFNERELSAKPIEDAE